jgi:ABC-type branched-subunit amino acid transport system substrate-binding protein
MVHGQNVMRTHLKKIASHVTGTLQHTNIGIVHSDSSFGILNANYMESLLKAYQFDAQPLQVSKQIYSNRQFNFDEIVSGFNRSKPHVIISLLTSKPTARIIQEIWKSGNHTTDFVGSEGNFFAAKQFDDGDINFYYSSAVPSLDQIEYPIVAEYLEASRAYLPDQVPNTLSLTYYINMKLLAQALEQVIIEKKNICKEAVLAALDSIKDREIGGFIGEFNRKTHVMYPLNISMLKG